MRIEKTNKVVCCNNVIRMNALSDQKIQQIIVIVGTLNVSLLKLKIVDTVPSLPLSSCTWCLR